MFRFRKKERGVITVFVSMLLLSVLTFGTLIIEAGRLHSAKSQLSEVNISAATSVLSNYDFDLYQRYGILAYKLDSDTKKRFLDYIDFDSDLDADYKGNNATCLYDIKDAKITGFYNLTYPSVLKRQIMSKSKYLKSSYTFAMDFGNMPNIISDFNNKVNKVSSMLSQVANSSQAPDGTYVQAFKKIEESYKNLTIYDKSENAELSTSVTSILPSKTGIAKDVIPQSEVDSIQATLDDAKRVVPQYASSIGSIVASTEDQESTVCVSIDSSRVRDNMKQAKVSGTGNLADTAYKTLTSMKSIFGQLSSGEEGQNNLLLNCYLTKHCSNRVATPKGGFVAPSSGSKTAPTEAFVKSYAEYIFGGSSSEFTNQEAAYWEIFFFRFCDNLNCIVSNYSVGVNNATKILWAYYESMIDMTLMTDNSREVVVPITKSNLFLPINNAGALGNFSRTTDVYDVIKNKIGSLNSTVNMSVNGVDEVTSYRSCKGSNYAGYSDYISIALWFVSNADKLTRLSDIIQIEMRYSQSHTSAGAAEVFRSQDYYTYCKVETTAQFRTLLPVISIDEHGEAFSHASFTRVKYVGF